MLLSELLLENNETLQRMAAFGLSKYDIDDDGYITVYHGTVLPVSNLKKGEIFYMTPDYDTALDYAKIRQHETGKKGTVQEIKIKPDDVYWNQGSYEIEFDKGGKIIDGKLIPNSTQKSHKPRNKNIAYKNITIGTILPKTKYKVVDIIIHNSGKAQFLLNTGKNNNIWYDADTVIKYETN